MHIDELVEHWTILEDERGLIAGKRDGTRLAFTLLLEYYTQHGRFPQGRSDLPDEAVDRRHPRRDRTVAGRGPLRSALARLHMLRAAR